MSKEDGDGYDKSVHFSIPPRVFYLILSGSLFSGAGLYGALGPQLEKSAVQACFDNSQIALDVASQHGQEFVIVKGDIARLERLIYDRTRFRFTSEDAAKESSKNERDHSTLQREIQANEKSIERLKERVK